MPKNNSRSKYKFIGIGLSVLFVFVLLLVLFKPKSDINTDPGTEEPVSEPVLLVQNNDSTESFIETSSSDFDLIPIPAPLYTGEPFVQLNEDVPLFTEEEKQSIKGIVYSELDKLGRCGPAYGLIGPDTLPDVQRGPIGDVKPSGWQTVRYDNLIEDRYLYNRCHLIAYQLAGANAEERNLITGTRYLNVTGMLPIENQVWEYVKGTGNHVLYRVTPIFEEDNLVASGVVIEAYSVEDKGKGIQLCRYLFNVQPGIVIDYTNGDSYEDAVFSLDPIESEDEIIEFNSDTKAVTRQMPVTENTDEITYVLNINTMRFHKPSCQSVTDMKEKNRRYSYETREELIEEGYIPCGSCKP